MASRMAGTIAALGAALWLAQAQPARAGGEPAVDALPDEIARALRETTTREAFDRALARLESVPSGMPVERFIAFMGGAQLIKDGQAVAVIMDGYLPGESARLDEVCGDLGASCLAFGYVAGGGEQARILVVTVEGRVTAVLRIGADPVWAARRAPGGRAAS